MSPGSADELLSTAAGAYISKLTLTDFRNYAALALDLDPGIVVFSGDNGAGKTNLLEAISLLTPGRGLRRAAYAEIAREGSTGGFAVHARLDGPSGALRDRHRHVRSGTRRRHEPAGAHQRSARNRPTTCSNGCASCG